MLSVSKEFLLRGGKKRNKLLNALASVGKLYLKFILYIFLYKKIEKQF